jgi:formylglycine-generating enzyme required for sulfatase activity
VSIPAGTFQMGCVASDRACEGDEQPARTIRLTRGFAMSRTEVTVDQFTAWAASEDVIVPPQPDWNRNGANPIVNVTWQEASTFCRAAGGRLPSEAEWEYAARGGAAGQVYPWGDTFDRNRANGLGQGAKDTYQHAAPVGTFGTNVFGLADMAGNVREWVRDWYAEDAYGRSPDADPPGPTGESGLKVTRGGSWFHYAQYLRTSARASQGPGSRRDFVGFRCAK